MQGSFNPFFIPSFIASLLLLFLGVFVYSRNKKSLVNVLFSLECFVSFIWQFCYAMMYLFSNDEQLAAFWMKIGYVGVIYISVFYYHFIIEFFERKKERIIVYISYGIATVFVFFHLTTNLFTNGVIKYFWGYYPRASVIHPFFLVFFIGLICLIITHSFMGFLNREKLFHDRRKEQVKYLFWAYFLYAPACVDYIANYNITFYPFGYVFSTAFLGIIAYAIVKHQLMNIEVIIRRAVVFTGLFAAAYGVFAFFTSLTQDVFQNITGGNRWAVFVPSILLIVLALRPLENFLVRITDRFLFQKKYDYRELLRALSHEVITIMDLNKLTKRIVDDLVNIMRVESCAIMLYDKNKDVYDIIAARGIKGGSISFSRDNQTITFLKTAHLPIKKNEHIDKMGEKGTIKEDMKKLGAEFILPLIVHDDLLGLISLGMKKSGEEYNQDDIAILESLTGTAAIAISNAQYVVNTMQLEAEAAQREKMAVVGTLAAGINHEICNPLGIARGQCEVYILNQREGLYVNKPKDEQIAEAMKVMEKVLRETDRATAITKKLSSFAKPSKGEISENVKIEEELEEVIALVDHELKLGKIDLNLNVPDDLPPIRCDRKQLQQVLFNIIRNAGQAIGGKGTITVDIKTIEDKIRIHIKDTGHGISKDKLSEIFNPFYTTKDPGKGTGLGLFIVRQLVERNKGRIIVGSEVGKGTTFTLEFPATERVKL